MGLPLAGLDLIGGGKPQGVIDPQVEVVEAPVDAIETLIHLVEARRVLAQSCANLPQLHQNNVLRLVGHCLSPFRSVRRATI
jgi:hypothetical protein